MSYVDRSETRQYSAGALVVLLGGVGLSRLVGAVAWVPIVLGLGSFAILKKFVQRNVAVLATLAAIIAQTGWFLLGAVAVPEQSGEVIIDVVVNFALVVAIFWRPGYVTAALAVVWNLFGIGVLAIQYSSVPAGDGTAILSVVQRALIAHLILRAVIVAAAVMVMVYRRHPDMLVDEDDETDRVYS